MQLIIRLGACVLTIFACFSLSAQETTDVGQVTVELSDLDAQLKQLQETKLTHGPYHSQLSEQYLSYGILLRDAGYHEQALDALTHALHIEKINHGIYSLTQRPALVEIFEINLMQGKQQNADRHLQHLLWIENHYPLPQDTFTLDAIVRIGNLLLDQYLLKPIATTKHLVLLFKADRLFRYAITRYADIPFSENRLPYGELALISVLKHRQAKKIQQLADFGTTTRQRQVTARSSSQFSYTKGDVYLQRFLNKAEESNQIRETIIALLNLGDYYRLTHKNSKAQKSYQQALQEFSRLATDDPLVTKLSKPQQLPAFYYAQSRGQIPVYKSNTTVHLDIVVDVNGQASSSSQPSSSLPQKHHQLATAALKKLFFRPALRDGQFVESSLRQYPVRIKAKQTQ